MGESKIALRAWASSQRRALLQKDFFIRSRLIQARVLQFTEYLSARSVVLYASIQNEVMTEEIRDHALKHGKRIFYPKLGGGAAMELVRVKSVRELVPGLLGIPEPSGEEPFPDGCQDELFVFVPGLAFDLSGNRLGRGKGWYDRLLEKLGKKATAVGLAYDFQIVDQVPLEPWDKAVAYIFTETRIIDCRETREKKLSVS